MSNERHTSLVEFCVVGVENKMYGREIFVFFVTLHLYRVA